MMVILRYMRPAKSKLPPFRRKVYWLPSVFCCLATIGMAGAALRALEAACYNSISRPVQSASIWSEGLPYYNARPQSVIFDSRLPLRFETRSHLLHSNIPSILHFAFGMADDDEPFGLIQYLSIVSAIHKLKPRRVLLHHGKQPSGFYWDMVKHAITLKNARNITHIFGNPVRHYAHKADIIRLEALLAYGGIYLDTDVFVLHSFDDLLGHDFVMGRESAAEWSPGELTQGGLCNAIILANKHSAFLKHWYASYRTFNGSVWSDHSVILPQKLAKRYPNDIAVLGDHVFFWPVWTASGLQTIFGGYTYDYSTNLAVHTWNSRARASSVLDGLSMSWLLQERSTLLGKLGMYVPTPLISVIVHCYGNPKKIRTTLKSLLDQTWPSWEVILACHELDSPAASTACDDEIDWAEKQTRVPSNYAKYSRVLVGARGSVGKAYNLGVSRAYGMWVVALHAGDTLKPDALLSAERLVTREPRLGCVSFDDDNFIIYRLSLRRLYKHNATSCTRRH
jgi:hypothetical protein